MFRSTVNDARGVAQSHQLDFLDFVANDGSIISSNEWPARFGYKMDWVTQTADWTPVGAFLTKVDTQDGPAVGLMSVSTVRVGDKNLYIVGGERLGKDFLASLVLPAGMRALLYLNLDPSFDAANIVDQAGSRDARREVRSVHRAGAAGAARADIQDFVVRNGDERGGISRAAAGGAVERPAGRAAGREFADGRWRRSSSASPCWRWA